ncbi:hypothetical protein HYC85_013669 [Camellia sinensis]|uniref:Fe2OG dioxygenase domain-containing protein n=1 Tax=Camellia sinensis TaxID=4442 RepID=A0A7J7H3Z3_CAMSI|nr:hypothetical protein HYC85_013669 [Camellia sinensis]
MLNDREKMGEYAMAERKLALEIMGAITESLGIGPAYLKHKMKEGMQVMVANCYPPCPQPSLSLGLPPHSDYSFITILLQSSCGFEILDIEDRGGQFRNLRVPYKFMWETILSLHSLGMNEKMGTAKELVNEQHPIGYKESSFRDFLKFLEKNDMLLHPTTVGLPSDGHRRLAGMFNITSKSPEYHREVAGSSPDFL